MVNEELTGLTSAQALARLKADGPNVIRRTVRRPILKTLALHFAGIMALLLWAGGGVAFLAGMTELGTAIWLVNVINGIFSFWQEHRAERAVAALNRILPDKAQVVRDGRRVVVWASELVVGDLMVLIPGERVCADGRLLQAEELKVDQSHLTGESSPVEKSATPSPAKPAMLADTLDLVFAGTTVTDGSGLAVVLSTGMNTQLGRIAHLTQSLVDEPSPLQVELAKVTRTVTLLAVGAGLVFFALAVGTTGVSAATGLIFALGMIAAFVPEGLLPTVTLSLALGVQRLAKRKALVKRLAAVETLGCTTVICTDKTGTLTANQMTVREVSALGGTFAVTGEGYCSSGEVESASDLAPLALAGALASDATLGPGDGPGRFTVVGDPMEGALQVLALKCGVDPARAASAHPRLKTFPFDSRRKRMCTVNALPGGGAAAFMKGAPLEVLGVCTMVEAPGGPAALSEPERVRLRAEVDRLAARGLRVLGVARRDIAPGDPAELKVEEVERGMTFLGLVALLDPPRPRVAKAVQTCHKAGIRVIVVTGDYGVTARAIALELGIVAKSDCRVVEGAEIDRLSEEELVTVLKDEVIFARSTPENKFRVVRALKTLGEVVAVTGDGVNDAPALRTADIGVAMGSGTDVAKESADMILVDDNFATIVEAVRIGRAVYANISKFVTYIFTSNTPEAVPFILNSLSGGRIPLGLTVMQILSIDLGTDLVPALALGAEPPEAGVMELPPRPQNRHLITRALMIRSYLFLGAVQATAAVAAFFSYYWLNGYWGRLLDLPSDGPLYRSATSVTLAAVVITQIGNVLTIRAGRASIFSAGLGFKNHLLWLGIGLELALVGLIVYVPFLQRVFNTGPIPLRFWLFLAALAPLLIVVDEARKLLFRLLRRRS